jgi:hypothetical protein
MMSFGRFNSQFRETEYERQQRMKATRQKRIAEGKCWQCAKPVEECTCPNIVRVPTTEEKP